jgi:hypothetical protein
VRGEEQAQGAGAGDAVGAGRRQGAAHNVPLAGALAPQQHHYRHHRSAVVFD